MQRNFDINSGKKYAYDLEEKFIDRKDLIRPSFKEKSLVHFQTATANNDLTKSLERENLKALLPDFHRRTTN